MADSGWTLALGICACRLLVTGRRRRQLATQLLFLTVGIVAKIRFACLLRYESPSGLSAGLFHGVKPHPPELV